MRQTSVLLATILVLLAVSSCTKKTSEESSEQRHATVLLQDGTKTTGSIVSSSPSEITLAGDDGITRTIPMKQVKSVEYGDVVPTQTETATAQPPSAAPSSRRASAPSRESRERPAPPAARSRTYELPAGSEITVRSDETIDSGTASEGQRFAASVPRDVLDASGDVAIPRGSQAELVIVSASKGGRVRGSSDLVLSLASVSVGGRRYELDTAEVRQRGKEGVGANKRTAEYTGGGAAVGAIIGAIAGGGKGAAIGAGAGAGAGALTQILTKGKAVRVPAESLLTFQLDRPVRIVAVE